MSRRVKMLLMLMLLSMPQLHAQTKITGKVTDAADGFNYSLFIDNFYTNLS